MKPALLIIDMQKKWIGPNKKLYPHPQHVIENINKLRQAFHHKNCPIKFVTLVHAADGSTISKFDNGIWNIEGSEEAQVIPELRPASNETVINKRRYSVFHGTDVESRLRLAGIDTCILTGYQMRACILASALDGYQRDFQTWVVSDATLDTDAETFKFFSDYFRSADTLRSTGQVEAIMDSIPT